MDARRHLDEGTDPTGDRDAAGFRIHHPREDPQERGLPRPVLTDQPDRVTGLGNQAHVAQGPVPPLLGLVHESRPDELDAIPQERAAAIRTEALPHMVGPDHALTRHRRTSFRAS